jgi:hypothetical protein
MSLLPAIGLLLLGITPLVAAEHRRVVRFGGLQLPGAIVSATRQPRVAFVTFFRGGAIWAGPLRSLFRTIGIGRGEERSLHVQCRATVLPIIRKRSFLSFGRL